ncbi:hypothetical protein [Acinetobacter boissieri]|uniref:DUF3037 domain-containing protein n=1 Tax=Acinetobacter boissieri TaxID=1219383 RepID=A0A1G6IQX4_9GAMM|nr:hypothetical protein [Acinetobacter boissieri]SDC08823.1 hypothetical protein SAMN05421733_1095 [Acinetobacter boissieri]
MFDSLDFPTTPSFKASWKAIYFEPVLYSGERITILIAVRDAKNNKIIYFNALHDTVIDKLYGSKALSFRNLVKYTKEFLERNNGELDGCIGGVYEGKWYNATSSDLSGVAQQGLRKTASLSTLAIHELLQEPVDEEKTLNMQWTDRVKGEFLKANPSYIDAFNQTLSIKHVKIKCGFYTREYSAKFNVCMPRNINALKSSLFDLLTLSEYNLSKKFDLILLFEKDSLHFSKAQRQSLLENIDILRERCEHMPIEVITCDNEKDGAERLKSRLVA